MKTTYRAKWGSNAVSVSADWATGNEEIRGLPGLQVADFGHDGWAALRMVLELYALADGLPHQERETAIDEALAEAKREAEAKKRLEASRENKT